MPKLKFCFLSKNLCIEEDHRLAFKRKIGHFRRMPLFETGIQTLFR